MTDVNTELLLFFYIQKRIEMVSEEVAILNATYHNHILSEDFDRAEGFNDEADKHKRLSISTRKIMKEKQEQLENYKTKRDNLMDIIEGGAEADC